MEKESAFFTSPEWLQLGLEGLNREARIIRIQEAFLAWVSRIATEIETADSVGNFHLAEERGQWVDDTITEEHRFVSINPPLRSRHQPPSGNHPPPPEEFRAMMTGGSPGTSVSPLWKDELFDAAGAHDKASACPAAEGISVTVTREPTPTAAVLSTVEDAPSIKHDGAASDDAAQTSAVPDMHVIIVGSRCPRVRVHPTILWTPENIQRQSTRRLATIAPKAATTMPSRQRRATPCAPETHKTAPPRTPSKMCETTIGVKQQTAKRKTATHPLLTARGVLAGLMRMLTVWTTLVVMKEPLAVSGTTLSSELESTYSCYDPSGSSCNCTSINLHIQGLDGTLPAELSACTTLTYLHVAVSILTGTIPVELSTVTSLTSLCVRHHAAAPLAFTCAAPLSSLSEFSRVELPPRRHLYQNRLTGTIPVELSTMTSITSLCVRHHAAAPLYPTRAAPPPPPPPPCPSLSGPRLNSCLVARGVTDGCMTIR